MTRALRVGLVGCAIGALIITVNVVLTRRLVGHISGIPYARVFDRLDNPVDILFALGDGQGFIAFARDPSLSRPEVFEARAEGAYRADRPLQGYLGWALSAGQGRWAEEGLMAATALGCGLTAAACGEMLRRRGRNHWFGLLVLILPGSLGAVKQFGPEVIGLGFTFLGLMAAEDDEIWLSVFLFSLAGLARETYLLVPLLLVPKERRFVIPVVFWLGWAGLVWIRFGTLGITADIAGSKAIGLPFVGLVRALPHLQFVPVTAVTMAAIPVLIVACIRERPRDLFTRFVVAFGVLAIFLRYYSWLWWPSFSRPLLPLTAFALIVLFTKEQGPSAFPPGREARTAPGM